MGEDFLQMVLDTPCDVTESFLLPENGRFWVQTVREVLPHWNQAFITVSGLIEHEATLQNSKGSSATTTNSSKHHGIEGLLWKLLGFFSSEIIPTNTHNNIRFGG
jgi:hypothetical protein